MHEHTTWQDWNFVYDYWKVSRIINEDDGSILLDIIDWDGIREEEFLFTYETDMVFTDDSITWFELEYKCGGNTCYDSDSAIKTDSDDIIIYIYDEDRTNYIAIKADDNDFRISDGSGNHNPCSHSLKSSGVELVNGM